MFYFKSTDTGSMCSMEHAHDAKALRDMKHHYEEVSEEDFDLYHAARAKALAEAAAKVKASEEASAKTERSNAKVAAAKAAVADAEFLATDNATRMAIATFDQRQPIVAAGIPAETKVAAKRAPKTFKV